MTCRKCGSRLILPLDFLWNDYVCTRAHEGRVVEFECMGCFLGGRSLPDNRTEMERWPDSALGSTRREDIFAW